MNTCSFVYLRKGKFCFIRFSFFVGINQEKVFSFFHPSETIKLYFLVFCVSSFKHSKSYSETNIKVIVDF